MKLSWTDGQIRSSFEYRSVGAKSYSINMIHQSMLFNPVNLSGRVLSVKCSAEEEKTRYDCCVETRLHLEIQGRHHGHSMVCLISMQEDCTDETCRTRCIEWSEGP